MNKICALVAAVNLALAGTALAQQAMTPVAFSIDKKRLPEALAQWAQVTGLQVISHAPVISNITAPPVIGTYTPMEALQLLLADTQLTYQTIGERTVAIEERNGTSTRNVKMPLQRLAAAMPATTEAAVQPSAASASTPQEARGEGRRGIEEVMVTATRREESAQDIPISIAVIGGIDIERRGLIGMEDYLRSIPGVNQIDLGSQKNGVVIRGITTSPDRENVFSGTTVAVYFDETPITGAGGTAFAGPDVRPVDIERIEVLRGPQGTSFGSSSLGGAVRIIPAKPKLDAFSAKVSTSYSETSGYGGDNTMVQGVVNLPLADTFAVRLVGYRFDESGFYKNVAGTDPATLAAAGNYGLTEFVQGFVQDEVGRAVSTGGRLAALWQATDRLDLSATLLTQDIEQDGDATSTLGNYQQARLPVAPQGRVRGRRGEAIDVALDVLGNLTLNYDLSWGKVTTVASWIKGGAEGGVTGSGGLPFVPSISVDPSEFDSFTAEARFASQFDGRFQLLGGVFYEEVETSVFQTVDWPGTPQTNPLGTDPMFLYEANPNIEQRALFGEVSYELTQSLTATVGGRYYDYDKTDRTLQEGGLVGVPIGAGVETRLESGESDSVYRANLSYEPTEDALLYASWAEGFRLGQPAVGLPSGACDLNNDGLVDGSNVTIASTRSIGSDVLENYEIGSKFLLMDRRLSIDAAVFYIEWDGLPVSQIAPSCQLAYTANAGKATSQGFELQARLFVTDDLRIDVGGGYTKAELAEDAPTLNARKGARLPGSPQVSVNLAAQYDFELVGRKAYVRADSFYVGKFYGNLQETPDYEVGDYVKVDARAGVTLGKMNLELFARNLTDDDALTWRSAIYRGASYQMRPRTIGIQLGYSFE